MGKIRKPTTDPDIKVTTPSWRETLTGRIAGARLPSLSRAQLHRLEIFPGMMLGEEEVVIPADLMPAGAPQHLANRTVNFSLRSPEVSHVDVRRLDDCEDVLRYIALAVLVVPRPLYARRGFTPKPSTWVGHCERLKKLAHWSLVNTFDEQTLFAHLSHNELAEFLRGRPESFGWTVKDLCKLKARDAIEDWPVIDLSVGDAANAMFVNPAPSRSPASDSECGQTIHGDEPEREATRPGRKGGAYKPLPDPFVSEAAWKILWYVENLGEDIVRLFKGSSDAMISRIRNDNTEFVKEFLENYRWSYSYDRDQRFAVSFRLGFSGVDSGILITKPADIRTRNHIRGMVLLLQKCHLFIVSLCAGSRIGEILSLKTDCVEEALTGSIPNRIVGKTFKLVEAVGGVVRDWPIHPIAVAAIQQQSRLFDPIRKEGESALWIQTKHSSRGVQTTERGTALKVVNLDSLVRAFQLETLIDEDGLHHHRFRKTIARLTALALTGAPKVLMDLFGHKNIEMTLSYVLSDPGISAEIEQVAREMVLLNAKASLSEAEVGGGPVAWPLRQLASRIADRGEAQLGVDDIEDAAKVIALNGRSWSMIRPGIICAKGPQQFGPCARAAGLPDPARCQPSCNHRFESGANRQDVEGSIEFAINKLAAITDWVGDYEATFWIGQLRHHLLRFDDIGERWASHPVVHRLRDWEDQNLTRLQAK